jgi:hypothetical protein
LEAVGDFQEHTNNPPSGEALFQESSVIDPGEVDWG